MLRQIVQKITGLGTTKMVFVVRTDIKMGPGKIASQCAHAAIMLYENAISTEHMPLKTWLYCGQPKIVLKIDNNCEIILKELYENAKNCNLNTCLVYDAGRTQVESGTLTVLGIGPDKVEDVDKLTKCLKLL